MGKIIWYEHINNSHAKRETQKRVVRKIYSEKKGNLQAKKREREDCMTRVIHGQKQSNSPPKKEPQK